MTWAGAVPLSETTVKSDPKAPIYAEPLPWQRRWALHDLGRVALLDRALDVSLNRDRRADSGRLPAGLPCSGR